MNFQPPRSFVRWSEDDYLMAACAAQPLVAASRDLTDALIEVNATLMPAHKRQPSPEDVAGRVKTKHMAKALEQLARLSPESRAEQVERLRRERLLAELPTRTIVWSDTEWALVYRRAHYMQSDLGDSRTDGLRACDAQMIELDRERWRGRGSLTQTYGKASNAGTPQMFQRIAPRVAELLKDHPFDPRKPYLSGSYAKTTAIPAPPPAPRPLREAIRAMCEPEPAAPPPAAPPAAAPVSLLDLAHRGAEAARKPQESAKPREATLPFTPLEKSPVDPLEAYVRHQTEGLRCLFDAMATHSAAMLETSVRRIGEQLAESLAAALDARQSELVHATVQAVVDQHFGAGVEVPRAELPPLQTDFTGAGLDKRTKVDVLGLFPRQITEVKKALNGHADAVRFVAPDHLDRWQPRGAIVIGSVKVVNHSIEKRCRDAHVQLHRVYGASSAVLKAIQEVYAQSGVHLELH